MRVTRATQAARSATPSRASTVVAASTGAAARDGAGWPAAATPAAPSGATSPVPSARWTKVRRRMWRYSSRMQRGWLSGLAAMAMGCVAAVAQAQPSGFSLVSGDPLTAFRVSSSRATSSVVDVEGPGFSRVFRIDVHEPGESWDVELGARLGRAVNRGEVAFITFQARAIRPPATPAKPTSGLCAEGVAELGQSLIEGLAVGRRWQAFTLPFSWAQLRRQPGQLRLYVGGLSQAVESAASR